MKKIIFMLLISASAYGQDSTNLTIRDSSKNFLYSGTYARISGSVITTPPNEKRKPLGATYDSTKWVTNFSVSVYASKADYINWKEPLFIREAQTLYTDKIPTPAQIQLRFKQTIQ